MTNLLKISIGLTVIGVAVLGYMLVNVSARIISTQDNLEKSQSHNSLKYDID